MTAKRSVIFACLVVSSGCATSTAEKKAQADAAPSTMLVCSMERPTGSNIPKRVCRTQEIADKDRRDAEELAHRAQVQIER
jgi:hypothetical protein